MKRSSQGQRERAIELFRRQPMLRLSELTSEGVTAATVSRMKASGDIVQLGRGLYQIADAPIDAHHSLVEAAKLVPKGVICLVSALAFHDLTDTTPSRIWMAIGPKDRLPRGKALPLQFVRFAGAHLTSGVEQHMIEGVPVRIYSPAKTIVDLFRYRQTQGRRYQRSPGLNLALEGLKEALRKRKATPSEIARLAQEGSVWKTMQPYLDAMTANA